jgi:choline kinase
MSVIITMAGHGSRFKNAGFNVPKFQITSKGISLFEYSINSLVYFFNQKFIFVCLKEHDIKWINNQIESIGIKDYLIVTLDKVSNGQAETAYNVLNSLDLNEQLWIFNIDTFIDDELKPSDMLNADGCLHVFESTSEKMSFVKYNNSGLVENVAEKVVISSWATCGLYGFRKAGLFKNAYENMYSDSSKYKELYIAPLYNYLININMQVIAPKISADKIFILGTPEELSVFDNESKPPFGS